MIDALENAGNRVELDLQFPTVQGSHRHYSTVRAKEADEHVDIDRMAFTLAHAAFFRRLMFSAFEREPENVWRTMHYEDGCGYGRQGEPERKGDIHLVGLADDEKRFWDGAGVNDSLSWITKKLKQAGVDLLD